ncbi:cytochrome d ubiquinol oxidase subunit II [Larsenimonas suaedae]|uniref:Cytochrome d ubiquinol oxidase subunit II n=1 Tax=Larsenimonas suaedae TaxID=1851019 RepID=A0ABU1H0G0_9GAMM|nr:cytochrome d ubiquinol oxidase subunit II [Larsenimonas suaedae]MDR5897242.1 cytochrome d ubiquinol oxidase subunit II [Larsenimonas suaedae]
MNVAFDLPVIWLFLIGFAITMYVVMDGFSLGVGILFPFVKHDQHRDVMMNSVAPVWDGNQTWMILGGAGLYGAFPLAYAVYLPAMYLPLILMLLALIFRGIAFEFRFKSNRSRPFFDTVFSVGSMVATFAQGVVLGAIIQGVEVVDRQYAGGTFDWFSPFSLFTGVALMLGYGLLGASWLIVKTEGGLQRRFYFLARPFAILLAVAMAVVSLWTPLANSRIFDVWFTMPNMLWLAIMPIMFLALVYSIIKGIIERHEKLIFVKSIALFVLGLIGLIISFFPLLIPPSITVWEAASSSKSQSFLIVGYCVLIPVILAYTFYSYRVFKGKVRVGEGYH